MKEHEPHNLQGRAVLTTLMKRKRNLAKRETRYQGRRGTYFQPWSFSPQTGPLLITTYYY